MAGAVTVRIAASGVTAKAPPGAACVPALKFAA
jgi:hypothetical protein